MKAQFRHPEGGGAAAAAEAVAPAAGDSETPAAFCGASGTRSTATLDQPSCHIERAGEWAGRRHTRAGAGGAHLLWRLGRGDRRVLITLPNPAGFEPRMSHVSHSGPVCRCVAFPHITCELGYKIGQIENVFIAAKCLLDVLDRLAGRHGCRGTELTSKPATQGATRSTSCSL